MTSSKIHVILVTILVFFLVFFFNLKTCLTYSFLWYSFRTSVPSCSAQILLQCLEVFIRTMSNPFKTYSFCFVENTCCFPYFIWENHSESIICFKVLWKKDHPPELSAEMVPVTDFPGGIFKVFKISYYLKINKLLLSITSSEIFDAWFHSLTKSIVNLVNC